MKTIRHILIFILIILPQYILGQEMYVHSFSHMPSDLSAKVTPKNDTNGELCALVKVALVEKDADFFGSVLKPVKRISGIYWVYMPKGSYRLRVLHDSFLPLDIDFLSYSEIGKLESGETYELVIKTKGGDNQNNSVKGNFLILNVTPGHASVKVDGKVITMNDKGEAKSFLNNGTHSYSIEANGYLPINEEVVISGERVTRNISLQSNRPLISIITTTAGTEIYVNEERKGVDSWSGNIDEGTCLIEGRKNGYKTHKMTAEISGKNNNVTIPALVKSVGSLIINYEPTDADIYIDNKYIGKTPNVINDIQTGQYELKISKDGYDTFTKSLVVKEEQKEISGALESAPSATNAMTPSEMYNKGWDAYNTKNYSEAVKWYRKAAEQGYAIAQITLASCYKKGQGVTQNHSEAVKWYRTAGSNKGRNDTFFLETVEWFRKAAEQGDPNAQFNLGWCYANGQGVTQDYSEAVKWYRKAAEQGDLYALNDLGICFFNGDGVTKDISVAVKMFRKAAEQGHAVSQFNLGYCYEYGMGFTKDNSEAIRWYKLGAKNGDELSEKALNRLGVSQ